jgi:predicted  nucleic acid-binding Zn-ribbon protein
LVDQLQLLVRLQVVDKVLFDLQAERDAIPGRMAELNLEEERLSGILDKAKTELEEVSKQRKEMETENEKIRTRLRRAENRLMGSKSQKEYRAANAEIDEGKDALKSNDDVLVELMERQEALDTQKKNAEDALKEFQKSAKEERTELEGRVKKADKEIKKLTKDRTGLCDGIESKLMDQYNFIRPRRQGLALAGVSQGTCLVCRMQIPPQQFNELQRGDKLMTCPSCSRIIYWADSEDTEEDK